MSSRLADPEAPNILIYEAAEGSLGILSQFVEDTQVFLKVVEAAKQICRFDDPDYHAPASYNDLLSYYNQRDHKVIDRHLIENALDKLALCTIEIQTNTAYRDYDEQYQSMLRHLDPNSSTERAFIAFLYENGLRLPDEAQKRVDGIYCQPDFYYEPRFWVFCDGSPHDEEATRAARRRTTTAHHCSRRRSLGLALSRRPRYEDCSAPGHIQESEMTAQLQPGKLVTLRGREWVVLPSDDPDNLLIVKPLGGSDDEITGIYLPLDIRTDLPVDARFLRPPSADLGDISTARLLYDSARLAFRNGAGPFRALAKLSFRPRAYQIVPLIMALRQETVRLLVADDVGVGKTIEALLIVRELLERRTIKRFAVVCLPHLCEQWQEEIRSKLDIEAVIIRSNTQAGLDRRIQGDASVYDYYPFQIISIDFIKSDVRRDVFVEQCPELVIVDETHTCARPTGASAAQQQRYHLISRIAAKPGQHLVMLTATPHSGKPEEFQSLLGLLKPDFELLDLPSASQAERRDLARHFIQRKRADVEKWMDEDTHFPARDTFEWPYDLSREYNDFFGDILDFARKLVVPDPTGKRKKRVQYWTALALLRGVMSSPKLASKCLMRGWTAWRKQPPMPMSQRVRKAENPVRDLDYGFEGDNAPTQVLEQGDLSEYQRRQMKAFAERLEKLGNIQHDGKLFAAAIVLEEWLDKGFNPVVFCRYIDTANTSATTSAPPCERSFRNSIFRLSPAKIPTMSAARPH